MDCGQGQPQSIEVVLKPHGGIRGRCSHCRRPAPGYDRLPERRWLFVPLWGFPTYFCYAPRRVSCAEHGVVVEHIPWSDGKRPVTCAMMGFLARWARRLSWRETAQVFRTSWEAVYRSVEWFVEWGLAHRKLRGVESIGVDEIHWGHGLGAPIGELSFAGGGEGQGRAAQAFALAFVAQSQSCPRQGSAKTGGPAGQQDGHGTGLGVEGNFLSLLDLQVRPLGRSLSRLLDRASHAQPAGAHEESGPDVAHP